MDTLTTGSLRQWFEAVLDRPATERQEWLTHHCADQDMRMRVRALLAAHARTEAVLLDVPVAAVIDALRSEIETSEPEALIGTRIGAFRLLRVIGQGGMATVFLAEREGADFKQQVAVKLLRRGLYAAFEQKLFLRERRTLAALSHPDIARLIDGGVTDAGIPYLVMDFIDGVQITHYAAAKALSLRARLDLFQRVCRAVDAAHRQLVVHRDIKPSNILVTAAGDATLLDFGIAKLLDDNGEDAEVDGSFGALTPGYAAPEQYSGGVVSTATDVYALGVLLHELLLGERPDPLRTGPPSQRTSDADPSRWTIPITRRALGWALRGDLDCLLRKALETEPEQRYASAGALADDIQRHLRKQPILARAPTTAYRLQKFAQRHRGGVSVAAVLILAVLASLTTALWQARVARIETLRAQAQTQVAQREAQRATAVRELLVELFENESPGGARAQLPDTATLLQRGAERARSELAETPALQVEMLVTIGRVYSQLSQYDQARPLLTRALATARRLPAEEFDILVDALAQLGELELRQSHYDQALPLFDEALALQKPRYPEGVTTASVLHQRGLLHSEMGRHEEAIADYLAALSIRRKRFGPLHPQLLRSYGALGTAYATAGRHDQALPWLRSALTLSRQVHGDRHDETARRLSNLSISLLATRRLEEAERASAASVAISREVYAGPNAAVAPRVHNLGAAQLALGRLSEAEASVRESMSIERAIGRGASPGFGYGLAKLARIQESRGDLAGALALAEQASAILDAALPAQHIQRLDGQLRVLRLRLMQPHPADLRAAAAAMQQRVEAMAAPDKELSAIARYVHGLALASAGDDAGALPELEHAVRTTSGQRGFVHESLVWFVTLAEVRQRLGDTAGATRALGDGIAFADQWKVPPTHPSRTPLNAALARATVQQR
jgi:serine/threonine-protein kinase